VCVALGLALLLSARTSSLGFTSPRLGRTALAAEAAATVRPPREAKVPSEEKSKLSELLKSDPRAIYQFRQFLVAEGTNPRGSFNQLPGATLKLFLQMHAEGTLEHVDFAPTELAEKLDKLRQEDESAGWHWNKFTVHKALGVSRASAVPAKIVQEFLELYESGSFEKVEMATDDLCAQVTEVIKKGGKFQWRNFCKLQPEQLDTTFVPKLWPADRLVSFLAKMQGEMATAELIAEVQAVQKRGQDGKELWLAFVEAQGLGKVYDPKFWPAETVQRFLDEIQRE